MRCCCRPISSGDGVDPDAALDAQEGLRVELQGHHHVRRRLQAERPQQVQQKHLAGEGKDGEIKSSRA